MKENKKRNSVNCCRSTEALETSRPAGVIYNFKYNEYN